MLIVPEVGTFVFVLVVVEVVVVLEFDVTECLGEMKLPALA